MSKLYRFLLISILTVFCLCSATLSASAQSVSVPSLEDLQQVVDIDVLENPATELSSQNIKKEDSTTNKKFTIALTDTETDSRFEVYALKFDNISYAPKLFDKFESSLGNKFIEPKEQNTEYPLADGNTRTVRHFMYKFQDNPIINVEEIAFTAGSMAIVLIGYYSEDKTEEGSKILETILKKMVDKPTEH